MRQTTKARHTLGIRGQLMFFLCFICLFLLGLFWLLSTQLLEPLYTKHIETQLTNQADSIVERLDDVDGVVLRPVGGIGIGGVAQTVFEDDGLPHEAALEADVHLRQTFLSLIHISEPTRH